MAGNTRPESAGVSYKAKGSKSQHSLARHRQGIPFTPSGRQGSFPQLPTPPWGHFRPATLASCALPPHPTPDMKAGTVSAFSAVLHSQGCFLVQQMFRKCLLSEGDGESLVGCEAYPRSVPLATTEAGLSHKTRPKSGQGSQSGPQEQRSSQQSPGRTNTCPQFPPNSTSLGGKTLRTMLKCPKLCNVFGSNFEKLASQIY